MAGSNMRRIEVMQVVSAAIRVHRRMRRLFQVLNPFDQKKGKRWSREIGNEKKAAEGEVAVSLTSAFTGAFVSTALTTRRGREWGW